MAALRAELQKKDAQLHSMAQLLDSEQSARARDGSAASTGGGGGGKGAVAAVSVRSRTSSEPEPATATANAPALTAMRAELAKSDAALRTAAEALALEKRQREELGAKVKALAARLRDAEEAKAIQMQLLHEQVSGRVEERLWTSYVLRVIALATCRTFHRLHRASSRLLLCMCSDLPVLRRRTRSARRDCSSPVAKGRAGRPAAAAANAAATAAISEAGSIGTTATATLAKSKAAEAAAAATAKCVRPVPLDHHCCQDIGLAVILRYRGI